VNTINLSLKGTTPTCYMFKGIAYYFINIALMILEPGYYQDGEFGIRLEDIILSVKANTPHNYKDLGFLAFETVTMCPIQTSLIIASLLTEKEVSQELFLSLHELLLLHQLSSRD